LSIEKSLIWSAEIFVRIEGNTDRTDKVRTERLHGVEELMHARKPGIGTWEGLLIAPAVVPGTQRKGGIQTNDAQ
jgi:hypothetical protein